MLVCLSARYFAGESGRSWRLRSLIAAANGNGREQISRGQGGPFDREAPRLAWFRSFARLRERARRWERLAHLVQE